MKKRWTIVILLLLAITLVSCGGKPATSEPGGEAPAASASKGDPTEVPPTPVPPTEVPPTEVPPTEVPPTEVPEDDDDADEAVAADGEDEYDLSGVSDLAALDTYRAAHKMTWTEENGTSGEMDMLLEVVKDPPAQRMVIEDKEEGIVTEMVMVDGATYISSDGEWIAMQTNIDEELTQTGWWNTADYLASTGKGKFMGNETVNGVKTKHYRSTEKELGAAMAPGMDLEKVTVDVWVAPKENIFVKYVVEWEGMVDEDTGKGTFFMESNLIEYNKPLQITAPEGVDKPETPEDVPVMDGAENLAIMGGMTSYQVEASQDEVVDFYKEQMVANGWTAEQAFMPTMLPFAKGDRSASVIIGEEGEGLVSVVVMTE